MAAYPPGPDRMIPGITNAQIGAVSVPTLVFRNNRTDPIHLRETSDEVGALIRGAQIVDPPWGEFYWRERHEGDSRGESWCGPWPLLVPRLIEWRETANFVKL